MSDAYYDSVRYGCGDCMCCFEDECNLGADSGCPTNSLGEFTCPCTGD